VIGPGGAGGLGGQSSVSGAAGQFAGGGGGGIGSSGSAGAGAAGVIVLVYSSSAAAPVLVNSMAPSNGTDPNTGAGYTGGVWNYGGAGLQAGVVNGGLNLVGAFGNSFTKDGGGLPVTSGTFDPNGYDMTRKTIVTTNTVTVTAVNGAWQNVNPATGPGLNVPVGIGKYVLDVDLRYVENQAAGVPRFQLTGPAISQLSLTFNAQATAVGGNTSPSACNQASSFSAALAAPTMSAIAGNSVMRLRCSFTTTASGTVQLQANTSLTGDTFVIQPGAIMTLSPGLA
jgi:hypothetical protein